jgi:type I restriction enzyme S subunit
MTSEYITLGEGLSTVIDCRGKTPKKLGADWSDSGVRVISAKNVHNGVLDNLDAIRYVSLEIYSKWMKEEIRRNDILLASEGASMGESMLWESDEKIILGQRLFGLRCNEDVFDPYYLAMYMRTPEYRSELYNHATGTSVMGLRQQALLQTKIRLIPISLQRIIGRLYKAINGKIELNNKINENLLEQVFSLYRNMFIETVNDQRLVCRASAYFDISIGKTPPRKEQQWFSNQPTDCVWVSIADMGNCGVYISDSSEYLTHEAVERFNVKLIPSNTVILSFKLTVGRVAITDGIMTTNEAIAHFKTEIPAINEYLYCYLKEFNYETMGSTSSIATAVNSKIIKGMPFVVPTNEELNEFHNLATPLFMMIKSNQRENKNMSELRDTLLPKLLNGEINV